MNTSLIESVLSHHHGYSAGMRVRYLIGSWNWNHSRFIPSGVGLGRNESDARIAAEYDLSQPEPMNEDSMFLGLCND